MKGQQLFLKPEEQKFISLAVVGLIEQLQEVYTNQFVNFNPEARRDLKQMLAAGNSLKIKMEKLGFDMRKLPPFMEGDEDEFLTKPS